jgi:hypothetical protein
MMLERFADEVQNLLDDLSGLSAGQADLAVQSFCNLGTG